MIILKSWVRVLAINFFKNISNKNLLLEEELCMPKEEVLIPEEGSFGILTGNTSSDSYSGRSSYTEIRFFRNNYRKKYQ